MQSEILFNDVYLTYNGGIAHTKVEKYNFVSAMPLLYIQCVYYKHCSATATRQQISSKEYWLGSSHFPFDVIVERR